jgi:hypothetical protein
MSEDSGFHRRALELEIQIRSTLTQIAIAREGTMDAELAQLDVKLAKLDALRLESIGKLPWPPDAAERLAVCRAEAKKLAEGKSRRRDTIGKIRLLIPRFPAA